MEDRRRKIEKTKTIFHLLFSTFLGISISLGLCSIAGADKIYLKDGKAYEGKLVGRSERRFLFAVDFAGEALPMSFFTEDVAKIELGKDTVESQIPYLKEIESLKVEVREENPKVYELSLYSKGQAGTGQAPFSDNEVKKILNKDEFEYYQRFNDILKKYADKFVAIQNVFVNLTTAGREDFASSKLYMDDLYFELNNLFVPEAFKKSHMAYLESVKATFLAFNALGEGALDEAAKQIKISEESKQRSMSEFRQVIVSRKPPASKETQSVPGPEEPFTAGTVKEQK